jgi:hypothetical protein
VLVRLRGLAGAKTGSSLSLGAELTAHSLQVQPKTDGGVTFSMLVPALSTEFVRIGGG